MIFLDFIIGDYASFLADIRGFLAENSGGLSVPEQSALFVAGVIAVVALVVMCFASGVCL